MSKKTKTPKRTKTAKKATYRVLARQPLSIDVAAKQIDLSIQGVPSSIAIRPAHSAPARQKEVGGSILAIEFEGEHDTDLMAAARDGFELIEDFLSAVSLVSGSTFGPSTLDQVARLGAGKEENCEFVQFLQLPNHHWPEAISEPMIKSVRGLLAHWDGLESGKRLRRAARRYREAAGRLDDIAAFQGAYIGLEAMEPPLAKMVGLTPGTELMKGKCEHCGGEYARKKNTLVGVRAFVLDGLDPGSADPRRKGDWKLINTLRNDLMHGLADEGELRSRPFDALIASMHYLHDAISICSHASDQYSEKYRLARAFPWVLAGSYTTRSWKDLSEWDRIIETSEFKWVSHEGHGLVPEIHIVNHGKKDLGGVFARLGKPISFATMSDVQPLSNMLMD
ncbi:hypothetical protein [Mesorhizobium erdmanii]|uniref:hypothetical protein n=1 Tax=Mesorhizobium erdmanii TaxID=1777866 RepID=UPI00047CD404|nr:hypothetical protein [Mesorhizobium erdmanii]